MYRHASVTYHIVFKFQFIMLKYQHIYNEKVSAYMHGDNDEVSSYIVI